MLYIEGVERLPVDRPKISAAQSVILRLREGGPIYISAQVLSELNFTLIRKAGRSQLEAARTLRDWLDGSVLCEVNEGVVRNAASLAELHGLQTYDAVILASVAGHADVLLSEDMQDGFVSNGVRIVNPFTDRSLLPPLS